ncbi:hypothetical protein [Rhizobium sp. 9140]|uniref:hypothetical protein n=1 Tax=Rhizobium sp. 9140 TaxID=1761900 RepID=UPI0007937787|nr:hypothetical protein [Rhizobium sp. 9140]CZT33811.1 hypothetical protein GA0004734_00008330 [Rhizobium sp. 9140]
MSKLSYAVVVDDHHIDATRAIADTMSSQGFIVMSVMPDIGAIYGEAEETVASRIRKMEGIEEVRLSMDVQLPPFSSAVPQ